MLIHSFLAVFTSAFSSCRLLVKVCCGALNSPLSAVSSMSKKNQLTLPRGGFPCSCLGFCLFPPRFVPLPSLRFARSHRSPLGASGGLPSRRPGVPGNHYNNIYHGKR